MPCPPCIKHNHLIYCNLSKRTRHAVSLLCCANAHCHFQLIALSLALNVNDRRMNFLISFRIVATCTSIGRADTSLVIVFTCSAIFGITAPTRVAAIPRVESFIFSAASEYTHIGGEQDGLAAIRFDCFEGVDERLDALVSCCHIAKNFGVKNVVVSLCEHLMLAFCLVFIGSK